MRALYAAVVAVLLAVLPGTAPAAIITQNITLSATPTSFEEYGVPGAGLRYRTWDFTLENGGLSPFNVVAGDQLIATFTFLDPINVVGSSGPDTERFLFEFFNQAPANVFASTGLRGVNVLGATGDFLGDDPPMDGVFYSVGREGLLFKLSLTSPTAL